MRIRSRAVCFRSRAVRPCGTGAVCFVLTLSALPRLAPDGAPDDRRAAIRGLGLRPGMLIPQGVGQDTLIRSRAAVAG
jgi:hypothetical protein